METKVKKYQIVYEKLNPFDLSFIFDGKIYLDECLRNYPELKKKLIQHELKHLVNNDDLVKDYKLDLKSPFRWKDYFIMFMNKPWFIFLSPFIFVRRVNKLLTLDVSRFINFLMLVFIVVMFYVVNFLMR